MTFNVANRFFQIMLARILSRDDLSVITYIGHKDHALKFDPQDPADKYSLFSDMSVLLYELMYILKIKKHATILSQKHDTTLKQNHATVQHYIGPGGSLNSQNLLLQFN